MIEIETTLVFAPTSELVNSGGYIAHPYRVAMNRLIDIQKQSGVNRARSEKKRREALEAHLSSIGMTLADYQALEREANDPFFRNANGYIIIPQDKFMSALVNASLEAPSKLRIDNLRCAVGATTFTTTKREADGLWERFAVVKSGSGKQLSNQRGYRANPYIRDFTATGTLTVEESMVKPDAVLELLRWGGKNIGIGASRKMGWGRFTVKA